MRFWDSSAVVPIVFEESTTNAVRELIRQDGEMVVWWGTSVECSSAVSRRAGEGASPVLIAQAHAALARLESRWREVQPDEAVKQVARRLLGDHPLRGADALQLSAAFVAANHLASSLEFVSLDTRLIEAARLEGFRIIDVDATQ